MVFNPVSNFANCIKNRPPLVIFSLCLFSFVITTVSLAYYVQHTDKIENKDVQEQWLSLAKFIDKNGLCIVDDALDIKSNISTVEKVNISSYAILTMPPSNKTFFHGIISLKDWSFPCLDKTYKPDNIELFFTIPQTKEVSNDHSVCVTISGPKKFMPHVNTEVNCQIQEEKEHSKRFAVSNNLALCTDNNFVRLEFDRNSINKAESEEYLSLVDKSIINMHLIATSYFLIVLILIIICYALIKGNKGEQKQDARHLLTGKVLHT